MTLHKKKNVSITGWGNYPRGNSDLIRPEKHRDLVIDEESYLPRGLGRSYGDAALNTGHSVVLMERLNRFLHFDKNIGLLTAEAGVAMNEVLEVIVPQGWFVPVTPGTKYVTLGGCVASDVHGKNHHYDGSFGNFVRELQLALPDGSFQVCSPIKDPDLFWATVGGMGLTGIISQVTLQLIPIESAYMSVRHYEGNNLEETLEILENREKDDLYSTAWIDCLPMHKGFVKSVVMNGHHATSQDLSTMKSAPLSMPQKKNHSLPFFVPSFLINPYFVKIFNTFYYHLKMTKNEPFIVDYDSYFYPLDNVIHWNRLYGKRGFLQYQFVIPEKGSYECFTSIFSELCKSKCPVYIAVLKKFGEQGEGMLSFPKKGYTLALDFPFSDDLFPFFDRLDEIVLKYDGRVYLSKDARMSPAVFKAMYPRIQELLKVKDRVDPDRKIISDLYRRLQIE